MKKKLHVDKFSVVMPIHNEEKFLPYSLPSIFRLNPDEIILIFDRCIDKSIQISRRIINSFGFSLKTRIIEKNELSPDWSLRVAFIRRFGFKIAHNDIILSTDADVVLSREITQHFQLIGKREIALISFGHTLYPYTIQFFISKLLSKFSTRKGFSGITVFSKKAWLETESQNSVKKIRNAEDSYQRISLLRKYKYLYIPTKTIHLRSGETKRKQFLKGIAYWEVKQSPLWKAILHSIVYLRPLVLVGYLQARSKKIYI